MASSFVHLHLHTQFSLLDGANQIDPLVDSCYQRTAVTVSLATENIAAG